MMWYNKHHNESFQVSHDVRLKKRKKIVDELKWCDIMFTSRQQRDLPFKHTDDSWSNKGTDKLKYFNTVPLLLHTDWL